MNMSFGLKSIHPEEVWPDAFIQNLHPKQTKGETLKSFETLSLNI